MANNTRASADAVLKVYYDGQKIQNLCFGSDERPLMKMLMSKKNTFGRNYPLPVTYGQGQGRSATFSDAQGNATATKYESYDLTPTANYQVIRMNGRLLRSIVNDKQSFVQGVKEYMDEGLNNLSNNIESDLFRDGTGVIGQISSGYTTTSITLADPGQAVNFEVGMSLDFSATTTGSLSNSAALTVSAVNLDTGIVTLSAAPSSVSVGASDYIFAEGDGQEGGTSKKKLVGLAGWLPTTAPTSGDSFFGVDRSSHVTRLAGVRFDGSGMAIREAIKQGLYRHAQTGKGVPKVALMSPLTFGALDEELGSQVQRNQGGQAVDGFSGLSIIGAKGPVKCMAAPYCPDGLVYVLDPATWCLYYNGEAPVFIIKDDGLRIRAIYNEDAFELRCHTDMQLGCKAPANNLVVTVDDVD